MSWAFLIVALCYVGICIYDRTRKKIAYSLHVQGQTETSEVMDLTVILFEGESEGVWKERLLKAYALKAWRLKYNNDLMQSQAAEYQKALEEKKKLELVKKE